MSGRQEREGWRLSLKRRWRRWRLQRQIEKYFREVLASRIGAARWQPVTEKTKYRRLFYSAETPRGKVFCKFYRGKTAEYIRRHVAIDRLLRAKVVTPGIVLADDSRETAGAYALGCLVTQWVERAAGPNE